MQPLAPPARGRRAAKAERRAEILAEAERLFAEQGYRNTSFDAVAKAVGIRREGLYYYFRNQADLLLNIARPVNERLIVRMEEILAADLRPSVKLYLAILSHLSHFDRAALDILTMGLKSGAGDDMEAAHTAMLPLYKRYERLWLKLLADGQACGSFADLGAPRLAMFGILGMCNWTVCWFEPERGATVAEVAETFFDLIARGLLRNGAADCDIRAEADVFLARVGWV